MAGGGVVYDIDAKAFWRERLKSGQVPEPEYAYVPAEEEWGPRSPWYLLREELGRHRCPACNKPFFFRSSAFDCHPKASAYKIWHKFAHRGPAGAASMSDLIRGSLCNPHNFGGYYGGGPYGL